MNQKVFYTSDEILEIFKEQHRLCSPLDVMADPTFVLTREVTIDELRDAQDLLSWNEYARFLNQEFRIKVAIKDWSRILNPATKRTLGDLCDFLATIAEREVIQPMIRLGAECLSAAVFSALKKNLKSKGVDVSDLRPSTKIEAFLNKDGNFSPLIEEATLTGVKTFSKLEYGELQIEKRLKYWIDKFFPHWVYKRPVLSGNIETFRDLVERILENEKLGS
ncbi:hypothetical protein D3C87_196080 [compost metagenome]